MADVVTGRGHDVGADEAALPDARLLWRWVGKASRPVVGWVLIAGGALAILAGYWGVSREALVAKQIPYLISGGIGGMVLVGIGAFFVGTEDLRKELARLRRLEQLVHDLHDTLLVPLEAPGVRTTTREASRPAPAGAANGTGRLVALPGGTTFHRPGCRMVEGKAARTIPASVVRRRGLSPCRLCEPVLAET